MHKLWIIILVLFKNGNNIMAMQAKVEKSSIINLKSDIIERIIKHYELLLQFGKKSKEARKLAINESPFATPEKIRDAFGSFEQARIILRKYRQANVDLHMKQQNPNKSSLASLLLHCFPAQSIEMKKIKRHASLFDDLSLRLYDQDPRFFAQTPRLLRQQSMPLQGSPRIMQSRPRAHSEIELVKK